MGSGGADVRIVNRTAYRTPHLRAILERVARDELNPEEVSRVTVTVEHGRRPRGVPDTQAYGSSGHATLGGTRAALRIDPVCPDLVDFAHVAAHEMAHLRGMTHRDMRPGTRWRRGPLTGVRYAWAAAYPMGRRAVRPPRPALDPAAIAARRRAVRADHAVRQVTTWTRKLRLATTKLRIWRRRADAAVRARDRTAATAAPVGDTAAATPTGTAG